MTLPWRYRWVLSFTRSRSEFGPNVRPVHSASPCTYCLVFRVFHLQVAMRCEEAALPRGRKSHVYPLQRQPFQFHVTLSAPQENGAEGVVLCQRDRNRLVESENDKGCEALDKVERSHTTCHVLSALAPVPYLFQNSSKASQPPIQDLPAGLSSEKPLTQNQGCSQRFAEVEAT